MRNIWVIPTDKPSKIAYYQESTSHNKPVLQLISHTGSDYKYQHIYITSGEEIKEGDWCLGIDSEGAKYLVKMDSTTDVKYHTQIFKIILTDDPQLKIQLIDDEFLAEFGKPKPIIQCQLKLNQMSESTKPTLNLAKNSNNSKPLLGEVFIRVFCGVSIEDKCRYQFHPLNEVIQAQKSLSLNKSMDFYSNSPDFVFAIKCLCQEKNINCEFFLNGESTGNDIDPIFENFNKSFDLLNELCPNIV